MKLDLSGCDIETLEDAADGLKALVSLRELVLTENEIEDLSMCVTSSVAEGLVSAFHMFF